MKGGVVERDKKPGNNLRKSREHEFLLLPVVASGFNLQPVLITHLLQEGLLLSKAL